MFIESSAGWVAANDYPHAVEIPSASPRNDDISLHATRWRRGLSIPRSERESSGRRAFYSRTRTQHWRRWNEAHRGGLQAVFRARKLRLRVSLRCVRFETSPSFHAAALDRICSARFSGVVEDDTSATCRASDWYAANAGKFDHLDLSNSFLSAKSYRMYVCMYVCFLEIYCWVGGSVCNVGYIGRRVDRGGW